MTHQHHHSTSDEVEAHLPEDHWPLPELSQVGPESTADGIDFVAAKNSAEYQELRKSFTSFAFPMVITFVGLYFVFVLMATYAPGLMGKKVFGYINVGILFGLLNFLTTYLVTFFYVRHANNNLDPRARTLRARLEQEAN
ncbi:MULTISPECIES: DUF485 domain-containing protein [unclassified Luteococcus]|uniref:DUF485 domain-containing protein n=1 Tax=unclassified Luteococcus TaxID=2639923 RepID=UPI00313E5E44